MFIRNGKDIREYLGTKVEVNKEPVCVAVLRERPEYFEQLDTCLEGSEVLYRFKFGKCRYKCCLKCEHDICINTKTRKVLNPRTKEMETQTYDSFCVTARKLMVKFGGDLQ